MWRTLLEHCQSLTTSASPRRDAALAALRHQHFVKTACRQAVIDGGPAEAVLTTCHDLLAEGVPDLSEEDRTRICRQVAVAQLALLLRRAGEGTVPQAAFMEGLGRLFGSSFHREADPESQVVGWTALRSEKRRVGKGRRR